MDLRYLLLAPGWDHEGEDKRSDTLRRAHITDDHALYCGMGRVSARTTGDDTPLPQSHTSRRSNIMSEHVKSEHVKSELFTSELFATRALAPQAHRAP